MQGSRGPSVSVVVCIESEALDCFGAVLRHLSVGLVDQAVPVRLVSSDGRVNSLCLGPIQALVHPPFRWPSGGRRRDRVLDALSPQPPTTVHAMSCASYRIAAAIAEEFDADLVLQASSLADCESIAEGSRDARVHHHAFSSSLASMLESEGGVPANSIEIIPPGVPVSGRASCFSQPQRVPTLLCTSRFIRADGVGLLIDALGVIVGRGHDVQLFLLADGPLESALRRHVRARGLSGCVTFAPPMADPTPAMLATDIFVRPSADTGFRADTLQAMAAGVLVVSPPNTACDHLRPGETAVLCPQATAAALGDVIEAVLRDRAEAERIAAAGMEYVRRHHGVSAMAERTAAAYRKLALARTTFAMRG